MARKTKTTTTAAKKTVAKAAPKPSAPETPATEVHVLRKKELLERVVARSGVKKKDAKPAVEAMLAILGEALANGEELNLQPLGKMMVKRQKELENAKVMICKLRHKKPLANDKVVKILPKE